MSLPLTLGQNSLFSFEELDELLRDKENRAMTKKTNLEDAQLNAVARAGKP